MYTEHRYFIHFTFSHKNGKGQGSSNAMWHTKSVITSIDDINNIQREMQDLLIDGKNDIKPGSLVITNYIYVGRIG